MADVGIQESDAVRMLDEPPCARLKNFADIARKAFTAALKIEE